MHLVHNRVSCYAWRTGYLTYWHNTRFFSVQHGELITLASPGLQQRTHLERWRLPSYNTLFTVETVGEVVFYDDLTRVLGDIFD